MKAPCKTFYGEKRFDVPAVLVRRVGFGSFSREVESQFGRSKSFRDSTSR